MLVFMVIYYIDKAIYTPRVVRALLQRMRALFYMAQVLKYLKLLWCANYC